MKKIILVSIVGMISFANLGYANACAFDSDWNKCMNQCTDAGMILWPACAFGSTGGVN